MFDAVALRDEFRSARRSVSQRALWCEDYPGADLDTCRYCGKYWRRWAGSKLDGHAACIVPEDFKLRVAKILRSPTVTYAAVAEAIGVTPGVVRSWAFSAGIAGPLSHQLRGVRKRGTRSVSES